MADLRNEATYRAITRGRSPRTETRGWLQGLEFYVKAYGGVAPAARALDVPRLTLRNWLGKGPSGKPTMPPQERRDRIVSLVTRAQRRARLEPGREARLRKAKSIRIQGVDRYDDADRDVTFTVGAAGGAGITQDTMDRLITAYLAGGEALDGPDTSADMFGGAGRGLFAIIADGMTDDWYRDFFRSSEPDWGCDVFTVTIR